MSGRRASNRIRGPQSALTDFLAANNISARQIRDNHQRRAAQAQQQETTPQHQPDDVAEVENELDELDDDDDDEEVESVQAEISTTGRKRKRGPQKPKGKGKGKPTKKPKKGKDSSSSDDDSDDDDYDDLGKDMYKKPSKKLPGQLENCDICGKRFTVTPYSQQGPDGGLCCTPCGKELKKEQKAEGRVKRKPTFGGRKRRQLESNRLDGLVRVGAKPLQDMCIEIIAKHHLDVEEFGDLPENLLDRLSQIFSKKRVLNPRTFKLFLRSDLDNVAIHDAALLEENDFKLIFAMVPNISKLVLRNAGQFKDSAVEYMLEKATKISYLQLYGANLITSEGWQNLLRKLGPQLRTLKVQWCDTDFTDDIVEEIVAHCPNLESFKIKYCRKVTSACLPALARLKNLTSLSLRFAEGYDPKHIADVIEMVGSKLKTLSLENCFGLEEEPLVEAIRAYCSSLSKLRLTEIDSITDQSLSKLFKVNKPADGYEFCTEVPPLNFIDLSCARDIDNNNPDGPKDEPIGLANSTFTTLMKHSSSKLKVLKIPSCRHISHAAFCDAFSSSTGVTRYPQLHTMDLSFCSAVDTSVMKGVLATCPKIRKIVAFGCFEIEHVAIPAGVAVIGVPRAQEAIEKVGDEGVDLQKALEFMGGLVSASA